MEKIKITNKEAKAFDWLVCCGYCELQHLLTYGNMAKNRFYNCGVYGWNYDIWEIEGERGTLAICTGYRNLQGKRLPYGEIKKKFEDKARQLFCFGSGKTYEQQKKQANRYQKQFYKYCMDFLSVNN